jgi:hypothetical protein
MNDEFKGSEGRGRGLLLSKEKLQKPPEILRITNVTTRTELRTYCIRVQSVAAMPFRSAAQYLRIHVLADVISEKNGSCIKIALRDNFHKRS